MSKVSDAVARSEANLCECDRPDELDNPHRHTRDEVCEKWANRWNTDNSMTASDEGGAVL